MAGPLVSGALNRAVHRYRKAPVAARAFVHGRAFLSDLAFVERYVPRQGFVVELGCGHGLFSCVLREASDARRVLGLDIDERKIAVARGAAGGTEGLRFEVADVVHEPIPRCDAIAVADVLYLMPFEVQEQVLRNAASALAEGAPLVVKAQERRADPRFALTYLQEAVSVSLGFTRGGGTRFFFPSRQESEAMFARAGFRLEVVEMPRRPYTDVLYLARRGPTPAAS